jgi:putative oxidoreductase
MVHGFLKLGRGVEVFAAALAGLDIPEPHLMAWITVLIEVVAGAAVFLGAFVTLVSAPMIIVLLVALVKVHWQFGFSSIKFLGVTVDGPQFGKPGVECDLLYLAAIVALYVAGPDPWSVDSWRISARAITSGRAEKLASR